MDISPSAIEIAKINAVKNAISSQICFMQSDIFSALNKNYLFDILNSDDYLELNNEDYISSFVKLPYQLRELYKVDSYEQDKRNKILNDESRILIKSNIMFS